MLLAITLCEGCIIIKACSSRIQIAHLHLPTLSSQIVAVSSILQVNPFLLSSMCHIENNIEVTSSCMWSRGGLQSWTLFSTHGAPVYKLTLFSCNCGNIVMPNILTHTLYNFQSILFFKYFIDK